MGILTAIFTGLSTASSFFSGLFGTVNAVTAALSNEKIALINAKTQDEQIAAQERVNSLSLKRDLMIAEAASSGLNIKMRFFLAMGPAVVLAKLFIWDKVIGSFAGCAGALPGTCKLFLTDPLDSNQWQVVSVVVGFYFLCEGAITTAKVFKAGK